MGIRDKWNPWIQVKSGRLGANGSRLDKIG
ncbi:MAG: hypothetical protein QOF48_1643 [Verrucomicrobiota bacterium]